MRVQHYKGGIYEVIGEATHTETGKRVVVYRDAEGQLWARPVMMFHGTLIVNGRRVPRFIQLADDP